MLPSISGDMLTFFHLRRRRSSLTASTPSSSSPSPGTSKDIRVVSEILMTPLISAILGVGEDTTDNSVSSAADMSIAENERGPDVRVRFTEGKDYLWGNFCKHTKITLLRYIIGITDKYTKMGILN